MMRYLLTIFLLFPSLAYGADYFDWAVRADRNGDPAGIYATTPYPLDENSTSYTITHRDEGDITYNTGTLYFVDGARPNDAGDGLSLATAFQKISTGLAAVKALGGAGTTGVNVTVLIRGSHDAFDGIYDRTGALTMSNLQGVSDTQRVIFSGYKQERPILDAGSGDFDIWNRNDLDDAYITLQRMKLQNNNDRGVRLGNTTSKRDSYFNILDMWFYAMTNDYTDSNDGSCYYLNADYGYMSHMRVEHSKGHGVKIGDGASYGTVEWTIVAENGFWPGETQYGSRTVGLDFPADSAGSTGNIARYNIVSETISMGIQLRRQANFSIHHNEVKDFGYGPGMPGGDMGGVVPHGIFVLANTSSGDIYSNIVRAPDTATSRLIMVGATTAETFNIYNNLLYDGGASAPSLQTSFDNAADINLWNNTIYHDNSSEAIRIREPDGTPTVTITNNIIYQAGSGSTGELYFHSVQPIHTYNRYYHPSGSAAEWGENGTGEVVGEPDWVKVPSDTYDSDDAYPQSADAGTDLSGDFTVDISGVTRSGWDKGVYEFEEGNGPSTHNLGTFSGSGSFQ